LIGITVLSFCPSPAMSSSSSSDGSSSSSKDNLPVESKKRKLESSNSEDDDDDDSESRDKESEDSSESDKKKKKKKEAKDKKKKKDKKVKKGKKDKKAKKEKKGKKDRKVKDKKAKKQKKQEKANREAVSGQFGKYGVIKAEDFYNKKAEFLAWAMEVKKSDTNVMGQMEMKNLFKEYIEDYNTATMPSKKYYNLQAWDTMMAKKRSAKKRGDDMTEAHKSALASFDDEKARKEEIKHLQAKKQEEMITTEVRKMKANKEKVSDMQTQARLRTQIDMLLKAGLKKDAEKLQAKLSG